MDNRELSDLLVEANLLVDISRVKVVLPNFVWIMEKNLGNTLVNPKTLSKHKLSLSRS